MRTVDLTYRYPSGRAALAPTGLEVGRGEIVAVLGPNGAGKSTLLRLLATDLRPSRGELHLLGRRAVPPTPHLRRCLAWVPDRGAHLEPLTGFENARFFHALSGPRTRARRPRGEARGLRGTLEAFGLGEVLDVPVREYSFGMRRKLLLGQALASAAELFLVDEPTVGLDPPALDALGERLITAADRGGAAVLATNDANRTAEWATRVIFLHRGEVVADGAPEELLRRMGGRTRIRVVFQGRLPEPPVVDRVEEVELFDGRLEGWSRDGGRVLPSLLAALLDEGVLIRDVEIREPGFEELFRTLTGATLQPDPGRSPGSSPRAPAGSGPSRGAR